MGLDDDDYYDDSDYYDYDTSDFNLDDLGGDFSMGIYDMGSIGFNGQDVNGYGGSPVQMDPFEVTASRTSSDYTIDDNFSLSYSSISGQIWSNGTAFSGWDWDQLPFLISDVNTFPSGGIFGSTPKASFAPGNPTVIIGKDGQPTVVLPKLTVTVSRNTRAYYQANYNLASSWWAASIYTFGIPVVNSLYRANWQNMQGNTSGRNVSYVSAGVEAVTLVGGSYLSYLAEAPALSSNVGRGVGIGQQLEFDFANNFGKTSGLVIGRNADLASAGAFRLGEYRLTWIDVRDALGAEANLGVNLSRLKETMDIGLPIRDVSSLLDTSSIYLNGERDLLRSSGWIFEWQPSTGDALWLPPIR